MGYNCIDLADRAIDIAKKVLNLYKDINSNKSNASSLNMITGLFIRYQEQKIDYYNALKEKFKKEQVGDIDFFIYDKISSLMTQFNNKISFNCYGSTKLFLECVLNMNKDVRALFIDIRGRLVQKKDDEYKCEYRILTEIIATEEKYIVDLEKLLRKSNSV